MNAAADRDAARMEYVLADPLQFLPPIPDVAALRGPGWAAIARGAALPAAPDTLPSERAMTPPADHTPRTGEPTGPPPLVIGMEVAYAGMVGRVTRDADDTGGHYTVEFPNGARVLLTDRDLGRE